MAQKTKDLARSLSGKTIALLAGVFVLALFLVNRVVYLSAPPGEDKECESLYPERAISDKPTTIDVDGTTLPWLQKGGTLNDASCLDETAVYGVVAIASEKDIANALQFAQKHKLKVSIAGVKHSMGGHAFAKGNIVLDMKGFNSVRVNEEQKTMTVQSGATWHEIQNKIHPRYAVQAMQSTDIFSIGGSISVNAHGMDHRAGAVENSIVSMRLMLPDGSVQRLSRSENPELYELVVGGYGLFGVILDAELELAKNDLYKSRREMLSYKSFPAFFKTIEHDDHIGLVYTHLSTAPGSKFLDEGIVYLYEKVAEQVPIEEVPPLGEISNVRLRRFVMNMSKYGGFMQTLRWWSEKYLEPRMESCSISRNQAQSSGEACLVARNEPMHDSVPYLKNSLKRETDILHEYFIPRRNIISFIDAMREIMRAHEVNLLNASIRVVNKERGFLSYAPEPAFSVVLYINQKTDEAGNEKMRAVTRALIDLARTNEGRFFLPYQLYYTPEQLRASYPNIDRFFELKRSYDPDGILTNMWYETYGRS